MAVPTRSGSTLVANALKCATMKHIGLTVTPIVLVYCICFCFADEWHAVSNICPRVEEKKFVTMEYLTMLMNEQQIPVKKNDGLAEFLPKLGALDLRETCSHLLSPK